MFESCNYLCFGEHDLWRDRQRFGVDVEKVNDCEVGHQTEDDEVKQRG
jgi:hypothetical protein